MTSSSSFIRIEPSDFAWQSIGTQQEKTIHRAIKYYLCPDETHHEFKIGRFVADIYQDGHITEIQTGSFRSLKTKLQALLPHYPITVVYPVIRRKTIYTIDSMGTLSEGKKSPRIGKALFIASELVQIKEFLMHPHLDFIIFLVDCDEYRTKTMEQNRFRKKAERMEQNPKGEPLLIPLRSIDDFKALFPTNLPSPFTSKDFQKAVLLGKSGSVAALNLFRTLNIVTQVGKIGRSYLYEITKSVI